MNKSSQLYYRVQQEDNTQGLWYNRDGTFNNRIVTPEYNYLKAHSVPMSFDKEIAGGWLSAVKNIKTLDNWFSKDELEKLKEQGFYVFEFKVEQARFYEPYQHDLIHAESSIIVDKIN
jgi:hypothetical protein